MFNTGYLLYCKDFQFNNGNNSKDKYFIVLKRIEDEIIIGSLPTSRNKIPSFIDVEHGCINKDDRCFNCYYFQAQRPICTNNYGFELPTFVYGDEIETYKVKIVETNFTLNENYAVKGVLHEAEFNSLIDCLLKSSSVKQKIKRALS